MANTPTANFAIPKPAAGDINWEDEYAQFADLADSRLMLGGMKNVLINGNFDIWQRGTSFSNPVNTYTADRFWSGVENGAATVSRQLFALGQVEVPGNPKYFLRHDRTLAAGVASTVLAQPIESVLTLAGETATVSFYAKAGAAKTLQVDFVQGFGTGGTPSGDINVTAQNINLTAAWQKFSLTFAIPSIAGKTLGSNGDDRLLLRVKEAGVFSIFTFDIARVQVEQGAVATDFERRPFGQEMDLCRRYFERRGNDTAQRPVATGHVVNGSSAEFAVAYVLKRGIPVIAFSSQTGFEVRSETAAVASTGVSAARIGLDMAEITASTAPSTLVNGRGAILRTAGAGDYIDMDAEL